MPCLKQRVAQRLTPTAGGGRQAEHPPAEDQGCHLSSQIRKPSPISEGVDDPRPKAGVVKLQGLGIGATITNIMQDQHSAAPHILQKGRDSPLLPYHEICFRT
jgi:hypothetical protein